jgi:hypothetical protein
MPKKKEFQNPIGLTELLLSSKATDFDGHTEFLCLNPAQRLAWLDQALAFIVSAKSVRKIPRAPELD